LAKYASIDIIERKPNVSQRFLEGTSARTFEISGASRISWLIKASMLGFKMRSEHWEYDVIYSYNHGFINASFTYILSRLLKKKYVINVYHVEKYQTKSVKKGYAAARSIYGYPVKEALILSFEWSVIYWILKRADAITVPSRATADDLRSIGVLPSKIHLVYLGIEHEMPIHSVQDTPKVFDGIYVGRLTLNKGFFDTLLAWKEVVKKLPSAKLAVVDGSVPKFALDFIKNNNLDNNIVFLHHLSPKELSEALHKSKLLVMPSHAEGFCFTVGKAILHHVPVVVYDIPVLREVYGFLHNVNFVEEWDVKALAKQIIIMLSAEFSEKEIRQDSGSLLQRYAWKNSAAETYKVFNDCVKT